MDTVTFLFTDIEGSTRMWEEDPRRMAVALARHDELVRRTVGAHRGVVVKTTGDGAYAAFGTAHHAVGAALGLQQALASPESTGLPLRVRCGVHAGIVERRDGDYFGTAVNRAARIMSAAHGGQVLLSAAVADRVADKLPRGASLRDLGRVRLRDLSSPERIYQLQHPDLRHDFPALRSLEATPNNLPSQVSSFIGREHELASVRAALAASRLVTLVGAGGLGKSRLALQVAADILEQYPDGVWLVELAPVADGAMVEQSIASVLGVKEEAGRPVSEALLKFVGDRRMLLILDNCEHLLRDCAKAGKRLLECGGLVRILATSREPLRIAGEATLQVPPLALPKPEPDADAANLAASEAVRLFADRATGAKAEFRLDDENVVAVADVCRSLDGIPLAIELAAARLRTMSVATIAARLNDRFRLLTVGDTTALPRQQTLRASIDWSHELLSASERAVLRRLAVFTGGWTLDAAEAVATGAGVEANEILDILSRLVEKSLVLSDAEGERYRFLETVREYARERLEECSEAVGARDRHLRYFVALAEGAIQELVGPAQKRWLARFDLERENLLAAHAFCAEDTRADLGLRLVGALQLYWLSRGLGELGYRLTMEGLSRNGAPERGAARCRALFAAGQTGYFTGRYQAAKAHLEQSIPMALEVDDQASAAGALVLLGHACHALGQSPEARLHFEEGLTLARASCDQGKLHAALNALAELYRGQGLLDVAEPLYEESLALQRERGERANIVISLYNLSAVAIGRGAPRRALTLIREGIVIAQELDSTYLGELMLDMCAALAAALGEPKRTAVFFGAAQAQLEAIGLRRDPADDSFLTPLVAQARESIGDIVFASSDAEGRAIGYDGAIRLARTWLAEVPDAAGRSVPVAPPRITQD